MYFSRDKRDVSIKRDLFPPLVEICILYIYICVNVYITHETKIRVKIFNKTSSNDEIRSRTAKHCCVMTKFFSLANETKFFPLPLVSTDFSPIYLTEIFRSRFLSVLLSYYERIGGKLISEVGVPTTVKTFSEDYFSPIFYLVEFKITGGGNRFLER